MLSEQVLVEEAGSIGGRIARAREAQSLSVAQSARRLGVKSVTWSNWENDRSTPRANKLHMLSGTLGVSPLWLLIGEGNGPIDTNSDEIHLLRQEMETVTAEAAALQTRLQDICTRLAFLDR